MAKIASPVDTDIIRLIDQVAVIDRLLTEMKNGTKTKVHSLAALVLQPRAPYANIGALSCELIHHRHFGQTH